MPETQVKSRKGHTKSRLGCSACKQRHQKCDETRPSCINCLTAHRRCPYLGDESSSEDSTPVNELPSSGARLDDGNPKIGATIVPIEIVLNGVSRDLIYVQLLQHWLLHTYYACVGPRHVADMFGPIVLNQALNSPYLMRSMLALAALHKASISSPEQSTYLALSDQLQSEGLTKFNSLMQDITTDTIVPAFLFAFITGTHRLCYTLGQARQRERFLDTLVESMMFLKGVQTIITGWWPYIENSELKILLRNSKSPSVVESGTKNAEHLSYLKGLISVSNFDTDTFAVYNTVLDGLRTAYNSLSTLSGPEIDASVGFVVVWMITIPPEFIQFVQERQPQALAVLAHAAPLFHHRRHFWGIGDAGQILLDAISAELPSSWHTWLDWPRSAVEIT